MTLIDDTCSLANWLGYDTYVLVCSLLFQCTLPDQGHSIVVNTSVSMWKVCLNSKTYDYNVKLPTENLTSQLALNLLEQCASPCI